MGLVGVQKTFSSDGETVQFYTKVMSGLPADRIFNWWPLCTAGAHEGRRQRLNSEVGENTVCEFKHTVVVSLLGPLKTYEYSS